MSNKKNLISWKFFFFLFESTKMRDRWTKKPNANSVKREKIYLISFYWNFISFIKFTFLWKRFFLLLMVGFVRVICLTWNKKSWRLKNKKFRNLSNKLFKEKFQSLTSFMIDPPTISRICLASSDTLQKDTFFYVALCFISNSITLFSLSFSMCF